MQYRVFIQTNDEQYLGALVAAYALKRNSRHAERFEVELLHYNDFPWLHAREGQKFLRGLEHRVWKRDDLQSFTPLRFAPPKLMNYDGRSVVIDPDCFAVGDVWDLLSRDMQGKSVMCRIRPPLKEMPAYRASSVMLMENAKLTHWDAERTFNDLFAFKVDYLKWIKLEYEPDEAVGLLENEWNDFDHLGPNTKILHTTYRRTQPWKTGLPIDFTVRVKPKSVLKQLKNLIAPKRAKSDTYDPHPDPNQERLFFGLLAECLEKGLVTEDLVRREMSANHVRHDALELCSRAAA
ncbi:MAG TPA: hypothetical protein VG742_11640 [Dongiaceae bacterium]|nr:hypothetical protein [Dongiaceae bacterium]